MRMHLHVNVRGLVLETDVTEAISLLVLATLDLAHGDLAEAGEFLLEGFLIDGGADVLDEDLDLFELGVGGLTNIKIQRKQ